VQDEITAGVAGIVEPALAEAEQQRALRTPPERLDAWEAYQRGVWRFNRRTKPRRFFSSCYRAGPEDGNSG
jgi:ABC-type transporter lipoprotein component MlaA